jgi:hypothetical protein
VRHWPHHQEAGAVSADACLVPAGWGLTSLSPMVAAPCDQNTFGDASPNARCTPCPTNMFTMDDIENRTHNKGELYTSEAACLVKPGWGTTSTVPEECKVGTFNEGKNRLPCHHCSTGWTTVEKGKIAESQCVIQAGWKLGANNTPVPCDKGTYSTGGTEVSPAAACVPCAPGSTTEDDEAFSSDECNICAPGHGGENCTKCDYGFYAFGGAKAGVECNACAPGSTSRKGATESQQCYSSLIDAQADMFGLEDESAWD